MLELGAAWRLSGSMWKKGDGTHSDTGCGLCTFRVLSPYPSSTGSLGFFHPLVIWMSQHSGSKGAIGNEETDAVLRHYQLELPWDGL